MFKSQPYDQLAFEIQRLLYLDARADSLIAVNLSQEYIIIDFSLPTTYI